MVSNHDRTWVLASVSNYCNPDAHHKIYPAQQRLTTKMRSKLQKLHHRTRPFSVLCALRNFSTSWSLESTGGARAAASCWDVFLVAGDGNHSNHGSKKITMTCRDVVASTKTKRHGNIWKKTVKSQKLPQEILLSFFWIGHPNAFQTWSYIVIASLASNSWSSMIQSISPTNKKNHQKSSPKFPWFFLVATGSSAAFLSSSAFFKSIRPTGSAFTTGSLRGSFRGATAVAAFAAWGSVLEHEDLPHNWGPPKIRRFRWQTSIVKASL